MSATKRRQFNLAKVIIADLLQHKWLLLLLLANVATAFVAVQFAHLNRMAVIEQDKLLQQRDELEIHWRHLLLEQRTLAEHSRVEALVERQLGMYRPKLSQEVVVRVQ